MTLKPWRSVVDPREDLRKGEALDAAEFAVHLDMVQDQRGNAIYWRPEQFFSRTFLTRNLLDFAAEAVRRLAGIATASSAGFNLTTQFGGGKTHALTLLYHLARSGPASSGWFGVPQILQRAGLASVPQARIAVFVGMRFDPRGGDDGTPRRATPWEEIAWQLAGAEGVALMQDAARGSGAPGGDTIGRLFRLVDQPILILMDEVLSYISRYRASGLGGQMYNFIHTLSEEARAHNNVVVAVSIPVSEAEMTAEDWDDYRRLMKMLDRLAKPVLLSAEADIPEIIRRRLFEWDERAVDAEGRVLLPRDAIETCNAYAAWVQEHRQSLPGWFPIDRAAEAFKASYPFHPAVISVFERKWQALPSFQRTRGVLRLLALWVSFAHRDSYRTASRDPLIGLGSAPLEEPLFRAAVFKQLGEDKLETVVTADICGGRGSHAARLDEEAGEAIRKARLHRQVATAVFFESNGGILRGHTTVPEIRLAVGQPDLDIGNVETVLEALAPPDGACFYLDVVKNRYWFSMRPNLTQVLADRRAAVSGDPRIDEAVRAEIVRQFGSAEGVTSRFFPQDSGKIPNQPALTAVVLPPEQSLADQDSTLALIERWTREYGSSARTFKSALVWAVADSPSRLRADAQKLLAWESIDEDQDALQLGDTQREQLRRNLAKARSDLKETVWGAYGKVVLLGRDNRLRVIDIGPTNSSAAHNLLSLVVRELRKYGEVDDSPSPNFLVRHWPPAFVEWSTKSIRDACFASPQFPRLLDPSSIRDTVARGVSNGILAYVGKAADGTYRPFFFNQPLAAADVEIADDLFVITAERAEAYLRAQAPVEPELPTVQVARPAAPYQAVKDATGTYHVSVGGSPESQGGQPDAGTDAGVQPSLPDSAAMLTWNGDIPAQKWVNFYMKVLTKISSGSNLHLTLRVVATSDQGFSQQKADEMRAALRELGLDPSISIE